MQANKTIYYSTTALVSAAMAFSTFAYLTKPELKEAFYHLGFPDYFRIELGVAKGLAAIAIWLPFRLVREASYVGLAISFVSAAIAHIVMNDSLAHALYPVFVLGVLAASYISEKKQTKQQAII